MEGGIGDGGQLPPRDKPTRTRVGHGSTRISRMDLRKKGKTTVVFDKHRLMPIGPNRINKINWSPSILICSWKKVPDTGDDGQLPPPDKPTRTRLGRGSTRIARMTLRKKGKTTVVFDKHRLMPIGPNMINKINWSPSILICSWKKVPDTTKELVWEGILEIFNIFLRDGEKEVEFLEMM